jgi:hypothetical protein
MAQRDYNHLYVFGRLCLQILLAGGTHGRTIHLLPQVSLAFKNRHVLFAIGFEWLVGTVNVGFMTKAQQKGERERRESVHKQAVKLGITDRQQELRWGW